QLTLPLVAEVINLLPPEERWNVGFTTYYVNLPAGVSCSWRCIPASSNEAKSLRSANPSRAWPLSPTLGKASDGGLVSAARGGNTGGVRAATARASNGPAFEPPDSASLESRKQIRLGDLSGSKPPKVQPSERRIATAAA